MCEVEPVAFSVDKLPLAERLLGVWASVVSSAVCSYRQDKDRDKAMLNTSLTSSADMSDSTQVRQLQQKYISLQLMRAARVFFDRQDFFRQILSQTVYEGAQRETSKPAGSEDGLSPDTLGPASLLHQVMCVATQPSPLKAIFDRQEIEAAVLAVCQHLMAELTAAGSGLYTSTCQLSSSTSQHLASAASTSAVVAADDLLSALSDSSSTAASTMASSTASANHAPPPPPPSRTLAAPAAAGRSHGRRQKTGASCMALSPIVTQIIEMGFGRRSVEFAIKELGGDIQPSAESVVGWLLEHPALHIPEVSDSDSISSIEGFSDSDSFSDDLDDLEGSFSELYPSEMHQYKKRNDFLTNEDYAHYVKDNIQAGMTVRCCKTYEEVQEGDIGRVVKLDHDGLYDLNVQVDWQRKGSTYWVRYIHIELLGYLPPSSVASIRVGDRVRVKTSVATPKYRWGAITHRSIGTIRAFSANGQDVTVEFQQQAIWTGLVSELELVPSSHPGATCCHMYPISGPLFSCKACDDFKYCENCFRTRRDHRHPFNRILEPAPQHWIRLEMQPDVLIYRLKMHVLASDASYAPAQVVVSAGDSISLMKEQRKIILQPDELRKINLQPDEPSLLCDLNEYCRYVEIAIKQCKSNGIDCKVHGLSIIGRIRGDDSDLASSFSILASEDEDGEPDPACRKAKKLGIAEDIQTKAFVWGLNDKDQLGGLKGSKIKSPVMSETLSALKCVQIVGGSKSLFIVTQEGKVYACGEGTNGRLGLGHCSNVSSPKLINTFSQYVVKKVAVHSGGRHTMALTVDGKVFSWGEGDDGKLGHSSRMICDRPRLIEVLKSKRVRDVACGSSHSAAIISNGDLYTWGLGEYGRLGHGDNMTQLRPKQVKALAGQRVVQVACGSRDAQTIALTDEGIIYSWGDGDFGKLGRGGSEGCNVPQAVERLTGLGVVQIECGAQFSLALTKAGQVWTWGKGDYFRLGHGSM
ncbi:PREDICTED: E3 ubiquitin-protein ligase HERC2-like [Priapulus caudatus]|uniref:E3 ubiquitin-protein ligase HERC2-like n=1 Tax=Priapulus caudatus TaxID=37621 RepID=A0ABM1F0X4_PRICU|nr:PREDICTED: E3 ubiquitin-protein ligase HERC2-like [Priapulus caudatus]